jgi:hypothetical protein
MQRSSIRCEVWDTFRVKLAKIAPINDSDTCHSSADGRRLAVRAGSRWVTADWKESDDWIRGMKSAVGTTRLVSIVKLERDDENESRYKEVSV